MVKKQMPQSQLNRKVKKQRVMVRSDDELSEEGADLSDDKGMASGADKGDHFEFEMPETTEEARVRIAREYLQMVEGEVTRARDEDDSGEIFDKDAVAHRLQQDVSAGRGNALKRVAGFLMEAGFPDNSGQIVRESVTYCPSLNPHANPTVILLRVE